MGSLERKNPRVPMAWRHREMSFQNPRRSSTPSDTSSEEVGIIRQPYRPLEERLDHYTTIRSSSARSDSKSPLMDFPYRGSGTLRSTRSVPALAFAAAMDPCPIHGGPVRRHGSLFDIRSPPHMGSMSGLDKKNFYGHSMMPAPPPHFQYHPEFMPPHMINPMMRPPHQVRMPLMMESIPVRDPFMVNGKGLPYHHRNAVNTKEPIDPYSVEQVCCKGHLIVLWIILGVVTVGVILGIIMGVTIT